jgi:hypothetical protein
MRLTAALLALATIACAAPQPEPSRQPVELSGRTAGAPEHCVIIRQAEALRISDTDRHTLLYGSGKTIWASRLGPACSFRLDDVLVTEPFGSHFCRGDIVRSFDRFSRIPGPACVLGDFVPYTR